MNSIPKTSGVYKIICTVNGKIYIGSAINLRRRWNEHQRRLSLNIHDNQHLQRAYNKYGKSAFEFEIVELARTEILLVRENYWIESLGVCDESIGFNIAKDATAPMRGRKASAETCIKIGNIHRGKVVSEETRAKLSAAKKGVKLSPETRAKIGIASTGRKQSLETIEKRRVSRKGYSHSLETRAKISTANKGKLKGRSISALHRKRISEGHQKRYIVVDPYGNEYDVLGLQQFCLSQGLGISHMIKVAKGKRVHHRGWKCRYADKE